jgi:hypothetical protein
MLFQQQRTIHRRFAMRGMSLLLAAAAILAGCSTSPEPPRTARAEQELSRALEGKVAQRPVSCLQTYRSGDMTVIDDGTILFRQGRTIYRNDLNGGSCNQLGRGHYTLVTKQYGSGLCRGDIAQVVDLTSGVTVGSCSMGDFVPYTTPRG